VGGEAHHPIAVPDLLVIDSEPQGADIIERLKEALEEAEAGNLSSVAISCVYRDGTTQSVWSDAPSMGLLIAAVTRLQHDLLSQ
jgi:hypothetical protein